MFRCFPFFLFVSARGFWKTIRAQPSACFGTGLELWGPKIDRCRQTFPFFFPLFLFFFKRSYNLRDFKVRTDISIENEKVFFAEKRVLRERFKVALKEIGKKIF